MEIIGFCKQVSKNIDFTKNPDLQGKKPLEILDAIVAGAQAHGLRIVLDRHRPDAYSQSPVWYTAQYSEQRWIDDWKMLATHYLGNPTVVGFDMHNEPHGQATWGNNDMANDWRLAAQRGGNAVLGVNPDLLIIVEGIEQINNQYYWWGGNLKSAGASPVQLAVANRVVYSPHDYPSSVYAQPWFSDPGYPNNLAGVWDSYWGYLVKQNIAPIWIGEFGTKYETNSDKQWLSTLVGYIVQNGISFSYWCWNPDSGDTGGILQDDWTSIHDDKQAAIAPALAH